MIKKKTAIFVLGITVLTTFTACGSKELKDRQVIEKPDKTITVIDNKDNEGQEGRKSEITVGKIDKYEDMLVMDWLDEDTILIAKENKDIGKVSTEGEENYPRNLYLYNLNSKEEKLLRGERIFQGFASISPDKKHILFKKHVEETASGFITDIQGLKEVKISGNDNISIMGGRWLDNESIIYPSISGRIYIADISGKITKIDRMEESHIFDAVKHNDKIYYISLERKLMVYDMVNKEKTALMENVAKISPSPDMKQLAITKVTGGTTIALVIADMEGNEKNKIAEGTQVYEAAWSPDLKTLAYSVVSEEGGTENGLLATDLESGKTTQLAVDVKYLMGPIRWSSSGKKLAITELVENSDGYKIVTRVITLS